MSTCLQNTNSQRVLVFPKEGNLEPEAEPQALLKERRFLVWPVQPAPGQRGRVPGVATRPPVKAEVGHYVELAVAPARLSLKKKSKFIDNHRNAHVRAQKSMPAHGSPYSITCAKRNRCDGG